MVHISATLDRTPRFDPKYTEGAGAIWFVIGGLLVAAVGCAVVWAVLQDAYQHRKRLKRGKSK